MDIKAMIEKAVKMLMSDKNLMAKFDKNPASVIEEVIGVDLPDEIVNQIIAGVRAKLASDKLGCMLSGLGEILSKKK